MARQVADIFTEVIVAPGYDDGAVEVLQGKKNIRILVAEPLAAGGVETRPISGGLLMQHVDRFQAEGDDPAGWTLATGEAADEQTLADLAFAWHARAAQRSRTRSCWRRTAARSASAWARSTASTPASSRSSARTPSSRARKV